MQDLILKIEAVLATLDKVELKGRSNIDKVLGCMQTLDLVVLRLKEVENNGTGDP